MNVAAITQKEALVTSRDNRLRGLYLAVITVMIAALAIGWSRTDSFEMERVAAAQNDREVWHDQGERNPHSAAHFSRYAFKPIPALSSFDPGSIDYAGLAVWMEAHSRNPATFRHAEGAGDLARFVNLSPAWVMQYILPLVVILLLFASYAGEREDGTLRQLMSYGASPSLLFKGKLIGALRAVLKLLLPLLLLVTIATVFFDAGFSQEDIGLRLLGLFISYSLYLFVFAMLALGVSALCSTRRASAISLFAFWCFVSVLAPRFSGDVSVMNTPQPDGFETAQSLDGIGGAYWGQPELRAEKKAALLEKHGVTDTKDLPINFAAYELQASEEYADPKYDELYQDLSGIHAAQEKVLEVISLLSPTTAIVTLSSGLAGTDRLHHDAFASDAEAHRRVIIKQMNDDMMLNAGSSDYAYQSKEHFWQEIADFDGQLPLIGRFASSYLTPLIILLLWATGAFLFARHVALRAANMEAVK